MRREEGVVDDFDAHVGLGVVVTGDGRRFPFHCTAIADGSRDIEVGVGVGFTIVPGQLGRWEAGDLVQLPAPGQGLEAPAVGDVST